MTKKGLDGTIRSLFLLGRHNGVFLFRPPLPGQQGGLVIVCKMTFATGGRAAAVPPATRKASGWWGFPGSGSGYSGPGGQPPLLDWHNKAVAQGGGTRRWHKKAVAQ